MKEYILDGNMMKDKESTHLYLKEVFKFPEYYGKNLDALYDLLTEMGDVKITIKNSKQIKNYLSEYGEDLIKTFLNASNLYEDIVVNIL